MYAGQRSAQSRVLQGAWQIPSDVRRRSSPSLLWFVQNYVFPPSHAELLSVRGTYKKHDAGDETEANTESQSTCGSEEDGRQES
jgi:hypothetical protein